MNNILTLNAISDKANVAFNENYTIGSDVANPVGIMLRSFNMHEYDLPADVIAVARAGAGTNNIPCDKYAEQGVVVFNTPGANANAVKELVIAGMLLSGRNILGGAAWAQNLKGTEGIEKATEKGKGQFAGHEIGGKTLGVIGVGAIGLLVANAGIALNMNVMGYDPFISVDNAWKLSRSIVHAKTEDEVIANADYLTIHMPLLPETRGKIDAAYIAKMKKGAVLLNFARGELVDVDAVLAALECGQLSAYVCDFPTEKLLGVKNVICLPHIGASTPESEDNCVRMAAKQLDDYIKYGVIRNSVNYPNADPGPVVEPRICVLSQNVPNVVSSVTGVVSKNNINIDHMFNKSKGKYAYTVLDLDDAPTQELVNELKALDTVYGVRVINP